MRLQLTAARLVRSPLLAAALALAPAPAPAHAEPPAAQRWQIGADTLVYADDDNVVVVSPQLAVRRRWSGGELTVRETIDAVSAASVDMVSQATRRFSEVRDEIGVGVELGPLRGWSPALSAHFSSERDYTSFGVRAVVTREVRSPDTTVGAAYGLTLDSVGRADTPRSTFERSLDSHELEGALTQVLGPRTLARLVYTLTVQSGYLEKPYRYVPLFDSAALALAASRGERIDLASFARYAGDARPPEEVPDVRAGHALGLRVMRWLGRAGAGRLDYRFYFDDWGVRAHTVEAALSVPLPWDLTAALSARLYAQSAASFWRREYVVAAGTLPRLRTIDRELATYQIVSGSARLEWRPRETLEGYLEGGAMRTSYDDYLLLDHRFALIGQIGVRWWP